MQSSRPQIAFSEEQDMLLDVAEKFARDKAPMETVRKKLAADKALGAELWPDIAQLGWPAITIDEKFGGSGLTLAEAVVLIEPLGRVLLATPLPATILVAEALKQAATDAQKEKFLTSISSGAQAALALSEPDGDWALDHISSTAEKKGDQLILSGVKTFITDAQSAAMMLASVKIAQTSHLVILDQGALAQAQFEREVIIDETRSSFRVRLDGVVISADHVLPPEQTAQALAHLHLAACLLLAAEMCGGIAGVLNVVVDYLTTRKQFGHYIGSYQALKHPSVDMLIGLEAARSHLYYAAGLFHQGGADEAAIRMAKAQASDAFAFAADRAIQFHGGFGFTHDCDAQLYRRRALWCEYQHGDAAYHRRKLGDLLFSDQG